MKRTAEPELRGMYWMIDRWRASSAFLVLTVEEQGFYRNLLDELWLRGGSIPNDPRIIAKASGDPERWKVVRKNVLEFFQVDGDRLRNKTLTAVRHESRRRAINQRNYRIRKGWQTDNGSDNGSGLVTDNEADNEPGHVTANR